MPRWTDDIPCSAAEVEAVVANYSAAGLPLEAMWTDIDHMVGALAFVDRPQEAPHARLELS